MGQVKVDTDPTWKYSFKISMAIAPQTNASGPATVKKLMEPVWIEDSPEPETSIAIARKMYTLMQCKDRVANERLRLIVHYRRTAVGA